MDIVKIVENIQRICREKGTNPTEAGRESGAGPNMVSIMKRRGSFPSIEKMSLLASYLGVTTSELLGEEKGPAPVSEGEPLYPPEYDLLTPANKAIVDRLIADLAKSQPPKPTESTKLYIAARDGSRVEVEVDGEITLPDESSEIPE